MALLNVPRLAPWAWRAALTAASLAIMALAFIPSSLLRQVDNRFTDYIWLWSAEDERERRLVLVDIDESSLAALGPWPWPREYLAQLADALDRQGAKLQIFDLILDHQRPGDEALNLRAGSLPLVLAEYFVTDPAVAAPPHAGVLRGALDSPPCAPPLPNARGYLGLARGIQSAAVGHVTPTVDSDGMIRRLPAVICNGEAAYSALSLAAYLRGLGVAPALSLEAGQDLFGPPWWLSHSQQPELRVPLDEAGQWLIPYRLARSAFISISAHEVLTGAVPEGVLQGAWALVGSTALGLNDRLTTPLAKIAGGMEIHAELIAALLDGRLPYSPRGRPWLLLGLSLLLDLVFLTLAAHANRAVVLPIALAVGIAALAFLHGWLLVVHDIWLGPMPAIVQIGLFVTLLFLVEYARTLRERERLLANLRSYLPDGLAEDLARTLPTDRILGERREACVWVADIRNYAAWGEAGPPEEAVALLHGFYRLTERVIRAEGGAIENYVGDAVYALWLPESAESCPAASALRAAKALLREAGPLLERSSRQRLVPLALGIGIECGITLIGSIGPAARRTHAVLGETVSVAIRLQTMTEELAQPILLGPGAHGQLPDDDLHPLGSFLLEGLRRPRDVYGCLSGWGKSPERQAKPRP